ncbi:hypothetical protein [Paracoccus limosus]|uniref:hypothetical protein n=1 Tax=Paracoccus limosus TaxID=913252 RepID=UPI0012B836A6|nr:hypothetical protein [Paracoccus limosus]
MAFPAILQAKSRTFQQPLVVLSHQFRSASASRDPEKAGGRMRGKSAPMPRLGPLGNRIAARTAFAARAKKGKQTRWIAQRSLIDNGTRESSPVPRLLLSA